MSEESQQTASNAQLPGRDPKSGLLRPAFGGKRRLINCADLRFGRSLSTHPYDVSTLDVRPGDPVVVHTSRGRRIGRAVGHVYRRVLPTAEIKRAIRVATDEDLQDEIVAKQKAEEAMRVAAKRIRARRLEMKLVKVEYMIDLSRAVFYFTSDRRIDFRQLVRDLARDLGTRIEMRQIGVRDGTGMLGGIGPCGKELCCSSFLKSFRSISLRFAKDQGLSLNPQKYTGMCGRLMCCLVYERPVYRELRKYAPRRRSPVLTTKGGGTIVDVEPLQRTVKVKLSDGIVERLHLRDVILLDAERAAEAERVGFSREEAVLRQRRQRRGGSVETKGLGKRGVASVLDEEYLWQDTDADTSLDEGSPDKPTKKRRRRRRRGNNGGGEGGGGEQASASSGGGDKPKRKRRRRRRRRGGDNKGGGGGSKGGGGGGNGSS